MGLLTARYGLALDNLLNVELVLADGRLVTADAATNPELFWALRGGGGNFGVVTAMRIQLHPVRELLAGLILFSWHEAEAVLQGYAAFAASAPDELGVSSGVMSGPDGSPGAVPGAELDRRPPRGRRGHGQAAGLGRAGRGRIAPMTCGEMLRMFDDHTVNGRHYAVETRWISALAPEVIQLLVGGGAAKPSPFATIMLQHFRGAANAGARRRHSLRPAPGAFPDRDRRRLGSRCRGGKHGR